MNIDVFDGMAGKLTQAHIDKGVRDMCRECPLALSISDMLAQHSRADDGIIVEVGTTQVRLHTTVFDRQESTELISTQSILSIPSPTEAKPVENAGDWEVLFLVAQMDGLLEQWVDDFDKGKRVPTGTIYIKRDGFITDVEDRKVQRWRCGITVDQNT